jgi:hypothetical protein
MSPRPIDIASACGIPGVDGDSSCTVCRPSGPGTADGSFVAGGRSSCPSSVGVCCCSSGATGTCVVRYNE